MEKQEMHLKSRDQLNDCETSQEGLENY